MNRILEIDPIGYTMTVEAGVVLKTIQEAAAEHDRLFPLSLGGRGQLHHRRQPLDQRRRRAGAALRQRPRARARPRGGARRSGDIWNGLRALKKDNTGYDLRDLYLGAEGTLGIITKAVLKLWPKPKDVATSWIAVPSPASRRRAVERRLCRVARTTSPPAS